MTSTQKNRKKFKTRFIDEFGRTIMTDDGLIDLVIKGQSIDGLLVEDSTETKKYNTFGNDNLILYTDTIQNESIEEFDQRSTNKWMTPKKYQEIDVEDWLISQCYTDIQRNRVLEELNIYRERNLYPLLKHLVFLVDHFRKNNIIWGVGRGSSVSSYVLYLIGIHKVNSLKYQLDIKEFLR